MGYYYGHRTPALQPSDTDRDDATSVEAVSSDGVAIDTTPIIKGISYLEKWHTQTSSSDDYMIGTFDSGYTMIYYLLACSL